VEFQSQTFILVNMIETPWK